MIEFSAHLGTLFPDLPPLERPAAARRAGYRAVEAWWPPAPLPIAWVEAVRRAGVRAVLVNAEGGDLAAGERGFANLPERAEEVVRSAIDAARVVVAAGGARVNLLVGRIVPDRRLSEQLDTALAVVREAAEAVAERGAMLVVEHLNPHDVAGPLLPTPAEAGRFVRAVGHDAVRLLYDAYHAARAGVDAVDEVDGLAEVIGHVQYADCPGRGAPGTGEVDLWRLVDRLDAVGYTGHVGLEFVPAGPTPGPPRRPD